MTYSIDLIVEYESKDEIERDLDLDKIITEMRKIDKITFVILEDGPNEIIE